MTPPSAAIAPSISVVMPLYNARQYLARAVASVQAQDYPPGQLQIVIVDDGSSDGSAGLAGELAAADPRIVVLQQANAGPAAARNCAIEACTGELIAFLDCDDSWEPTKLRRQAALYREQPELGLIHCTCHFVDANGDLVEGWMRRSVAASGDISLEYFCDFFLITSAVLVPRACLDAVGHFDPELRVGEDHELFLRLIARYRVGCIDAPLLNRTIRADSLSRQDFDLDANNDLLVMDRFLHANPEFARAHPARIAQRYASYLYEYGYGLLEHGKLRRGRTMLLRSVRHKPSLAATRALLRSLLPRTFWRILRPA
jgi:glycosyltransferase involved in cell wall biosynthesis